MSHPRPDHPPRRLHGAALALSVGSALLLQGCGAAGGDTGSAGGSSGTSGGGSFSAVPVVGQGARGPVVASGWMPQFTAANAYGGTRTETVMASVPFPYGHHTSTNGLTVVGRTTAWRVLQRWGDQSIKVAQAQFTDTFAAGEVKTYQVAAGSALTGAFQPHPWVAQLESGFQYGAEVKDTFGVAYTAFVNGTGGGTVVAETPLSRTKRHRLYHLAASGGIGRDYLASTFYVTEFRDQPLLVVDWVLGSDYLGSDFPNGSTDRNHYVLGSVDVNDAWFLVSGGGLNCVAYRATENGVAGGAVHPSGRYGHRVMQNDWIGDAQTRRYRFSMPVVLSSAPQVERDASISDGIAYSDGPVRALPTQAAAYTTGALGLLGGPLAGPADAYARAEGELGAFVNGGWFGTWGSRGDAKATGTTGTPRNHPMSPELAHAVQAGHHRLLIALEQKAWIQAARPYHLWNLTCADDQALFLWDGVPIYPGSRDLSTESLGRRGLYAADPYVAYRTRVQSGGGRAHGFEHFDHEHWSTDLLFDYWTITGDCWAQEEMRQLGQSLKSLMRQSLYNTRFVQAVRAEGWCMQGFVQCYLATGDASLKNYAVARLHNIVDVQRQKTHASKAMGFQGNYAGTGWPMPHEFYMPWQHGAVLFGYLAAYRHFQDVLFLRVCEDVTQCVDYAWIRDRQDPTFGFVPEGLRYYVPVTYNGQPVAQNRFDTQVGVKYGDGPLGGAHTFLTTGLFLLADHTTDGIVRAKALHFGGLLRNGALGTRRWDKWHFCIPEQFAQ